MIHRVLLVCFACLALAGCASEPMKPLFADSMIQSLPTTPADKAEIVFLEPINSIQGAVPVGIFKVEGNQRTLLAVTGAHSKAVVELAPGHHVLAANTGGMVAHFMEANVEAGKRYYVLVRFVYANGFQLRPLRRSGSSDYTVQNKDFPSWVKTTRFVDTTADADAFYEKYKDAVDKSQAAGWETWQGKSAEQRAELTLNPQDAIDE